MRGKFVLDILTYTGPSATAPRAELTPKLAIPTPAVRSVGCRAGSNRIQVKCWLWCHGSVVGRLYTACSLNCLSWYLICLYISAGWSFAVTIALSNEQLSKKLPWCEFDESIYICIQFVHPKMIAWENWRLKMVTRVRCGTSNWVTCIVLKPKSLV